MPNSKDRLKKRVVSCKHEVLIQKIPDTVMFLHFGIGTVTVDDQEYNVSYSADGGLYVYADGEERYLITAKSMIEAIMKSRPILKRKEILS